MEADRAWNVFLGFDCVISVSGIWKRLDERLAVGNEDEWGCLLIPHIFEFKEGNALSTELVNGLLWHTDYCFWKTISSAELLVVVKSGLKAEVTETSSTPVSLVLMFCDIRHESRKTFDPSEVTFPIEEIDNFLPMLMGTDIERGTQFSIIVEEGENINC